MKKIFQCILSLMGLLFLYMSLHMTWLFFFEPTPVHEQLVNECNEMSKQGSYNNFSESEKLNACLDDSYMSLGGAPVLFLILLPLFLFLSWINLRYGLRVFKLVK